MYLRPSTQAVFDSYSNAIKPSIAVAVAAGRMAMKVGMGYRLG